MSSARQLLVCIATLLLILSICCYGAVSAQRADFKTLFKPTRSQRKLILRAQNEARSLVQPPPIHPLARLRYSKVAEASAGRYATTCPLDFDRPDSAFSYLLKHSHEPLRTATIGSRQVVCGENLWWSWHECESESCKNNPYTNKYDWSKALDWWIDERKNYTYGCPNANLQTENAGNQIGHYTQIISVQSLMVGCARSTCRVPQPKQPGKYTTFLIHVCHYCPTGNVGGFDCPYRTNNAVTCPSGEQPKCGANAVVDRNAQPPVPPPIQNRFTYKGKRYARCPERILLEAVGRRWMFNPETGSCYMLVRGGKEFPVAFGRRVTDMCRMPMFSTIDGNAYEMIINSDEENNMWQQLFTGNQVSLLDVPPYLKVGIGYVPTAKEWRWNHASFGSPNYRCFAAGGDAGWDSACHMAPRESSQADACAYTKWSASSRAWRTDSCARVTQSSDYAFVCEAPVVPDNNNGDGYRVGKLVFEDLQEPDTEYEQFAYAPGGVLSNDTYYGDSDNETGWSSSFDALSKDDDRDESLDAFSDNGFRRRRKRSAEGSDAVFDLYDYVQKNVVKAKPPVYFSFDDEDGDDEDDSGVEYRSSLNDGDDNGRYAAYLTSRSKKQFRKGYNAV